MTTYSLIWKRQSGAVAMPEVLKTFNSLSGLVAWQEAWRQQQPVSQGNVSDDCFMVKVTRQGIADEWLDLASAKLESVKSVERSMAEILGVLHGADSGSRHKSRYHSGPRGGQG